MSTKDKNTVCPVEQSGILDNTIRRFLQNPYKILKPYIKEGMRVLDLGCGPGFFSIEMAKIVGESGKVIAADLQDGMLDIVRNKIKANGLDYIIELQKCKTNSIGLKTKVDFILAFYMIHEVPDKGKLFEEFKSILNPNGLIFIVEPSFHVSKKSFNQMTEILYKYGFQIVERPKYLFSRAVLLKNS